MAEVIRMRPSIIHAIRGLRHCPNSTHTWALHQGRENLDNIGRAEFILHQLVVKVTGAHYFLQPLLSGIRLRSNETNTTVDLRPITCVNELLPDGASLVIDVA